MPTEDKPWLPPFSPEDEKEAQKELARLRKRLQNNANGAFNTTHKKTGFEDKTLWDKLNIFGTLAIPIILALATIGFGLWQAHLADLQHQNDLKIAQDSRQNDLKIADDQQQETTLKAYLDDMTTLLLDKKLGSQAVADKVASAEAAVVARAKTLTALRRLTDPRRKATVVQFLYEAHLIGYLSFDTTSSIPVANIIDLRGADLRGANLSAAVLSYAYLGAANLSAAVLSYAYLGAADLGAADLGAADLSGADLRAADLGAALQSHILGEMLP